VRRPSALTSEAFKLRRYLFSVILCSLLFSTRQTEEEASRLTVRSRVHAKAVLAVPLPLIRYVLAIIRLARIAGFSNRRRTVSRAIATESLFGVSEPYPSICCARFLITVHAKNAMRCGPVLRPVNANAAFHISIVILYTRSHYAATLGTLLAFFGAVRVRGGGEAAAPDRAGG